MFSFFNKQVIFPEWRNLVDANSSFVQTENNLSSIIQSLSYPNVKTTFNIENLTELITFLREISDSFNDLNQKLSAVNADLNYLSQIYEDYQTKKKEMKKNEMNNQYIFNSKDNEHYQKEMICKITAIFGEIAKARKKSSNDIFDKISDIKSTNESFKISIPKPDYTIKSDLQKLQKIVKKNEQIMSKEVSFDTGEDDIIIIKEEKKSLFNPFLSTSDDESDIDIIVSSLKEQQMKEQEIKEQQKREKELREQRIREKEIRIQQRREKELREQKRIEEELREQQRKVKEYKQTEEINQMKNKDYYQKDQKHHHHHHHHHKNDQYNANNLMMFPCQGMFGCSSVIDFKSFKKEILVDKNTAESALAELKSANNYSKPRKLKKEK